METETGFGEPLEDADDTQDEAAPAEEQDTDSHPLPENDPAIEGDTANG